MRQIRIVPAHKSIIGAPVTAGTVDTTYQREWLTDGSPGFPVRKTGGSLSLTITPAAAVSCDVFAVCHHKVKQAATISLSGSVTNTIPTAAWPADDIPRNWYRRLTTPVSVASLGVAVTGNTDPVIIGEFYAGLSFTFEIDFGHGRTFDPQRPFEWEGEFASLAPYDPGLALPRRLRGELALEPSEYADLEAAYLSQRNGSRPVLIIPNDTVNDAWLAQFSFQESFSAYSTVTMEIVEIPRTRW
jgi:hypothetical protein